MLLKFSGYFLQKLINDSNNKISRKSPGRKLYLYSAHESNIAELLILLGVFDPPHIPNYGSYITFEIHKVNRKYGIKVQTFLPDVNNYNITINFRFFMKIILPINHNC